MKISVITVHTSRNYGTVLQTYATQTLLENMGHAVEFVDYWRKNNQTDGLIDLALKKPKYAKLSKLCDKYKLLGKLARFPLRIALRYVRSRYAMPRFLKKYIHLSRRYNSYEELAHDPPVADLYMTGSDQVWNSIWNGGIEKAYFLEYAPAGKRRVAFSASIGRTELDEYEIEPLRNMLRKYDAISMREQSGVELLRRLGVESQLVLDPTLMLGAEDWRALAKPFRHPKPYLLIYRLGKDETITAYAQTIAERLGLDVVEIAIFKPIRRKGVRCVARPTVEELLGCFFGASFVLTNSFHGTAFSLNIGKPFACVMPDRFATRLQSICRLTGTNERMLLSPNDVTVVGRPIDHARVQSILRTEREKSLRFLRKAIEGKEAEA